MERISKTSNNGNGEQSQELQVPIAQACPEVEARRKESMKNWEQVQHQSNAICGVMSAKTEVQHRLIDKKIAVYETFIKFYRLFISMCRNRTVVLANNERYYKFGKIFEQAKNYSRMLDAFANKLRRAGEIIHSFNNGMISYLKSSEEYFKVVSQAQTLSDLLQVEIPNLKWFEAIPELDIDTLADEWGEMQLDRRILHCLKDLKKLLLQREQ